ncbi:MAG: VOC family protein [Paracoccaceae bacterium]
MGTDATNAFNTVPTDRIMQGVIPYFAMPGTAGAAADFYMRAFGAVDVGRMPMEDVPGQFMHIQLAINGGAFMLTDHGMDQARAPGSPLQNGHLQLVVTDGHAWWDRAVKAGCKVISPFERQFWGDDWGLLADPFDIRWAILQPGPQS